MTKILMTDPQWFNVSYQINPWMRPGVWRADAARHQRAARTAFDALVAALRVAGASVEIIDGAPGLPDMVFAANAAVVLDGRVLVARFRPAERQGEEARYLAAFRALQTRGVVDDVAQIASGVFQEGAGDAIATFFGRPVVPLELASPRFYHLDTCFRPLSGGEVLYYPPAFTPGALAEIHARVPADQRIIADDAAAAGLCVNAVCVGETVVMAKAPAALRCALEARGYRVAEVDLAPFILSGGAAFCLTLRLDHASTPALATTAAA